MSLRFPSRPKGMHHKTYLKIQHEYYEALDQYNEALILDYRRMMGFLSRVGKKS